MIRINLLGVAKPKKVKRSAMPTVTLEGPSIMVVAFALLFLTAAGNYWWYYRLNQQHEQLTKQIGDADRRISQLSQVKARYEEKDKQAKQLQKRFDVIDQLRASQSGPATLLATISDTINQTDAVWLDNMTESEASVTLEGKALSSVAVANLMTNLKKTGQFKNVELKETVQDTYKDMQAFTFTLICDKASAKKA